MGRFGKVATAVAMLLGSVLPMLPAATERELAAEVGRGRAPGWSALFSEQLSSLARSARVSPAAYDIVLRALADATLGESPKEAAAQVFSLCLSADRALRGGTPPGEVLLDARETLHLAAVHGDRSVLRGSAHDRIGIRLMRMGGQVSDDMANRFGPRRGYGAGIITPGPSGGGIPGPTSGTGGGNGSPKR